MSRYDYLQYHRDVAPPRVLNPRLVRRIASVGEAAAILPDSPLTAQDRMSIRLDQAKRRVVA